MDNSKHKKNNNKKAAFSVRGSTTSIWSRALTIIRWVLNYKKSFSIFALVIYFLFFFELEKEFVIEPVEVIKIQKINVNISNSLALSAVSKLRNVRTEYINDNFNFIHLFMKKNNIDNQNCYQMDFRSDICNCTADLIKEVEADIPQHYEDLKISVNYSNFEFSTYLIQSLRYFRNKPLLIISSSVKETSKNKYLLSVSLRVDSKNSYTTQSIVEGADNIEDRLSIMYMKYMYPAIYAAIMYQQDPLGVKEALDIAFKHYDEFQVSSSSFTLLGHLGLMEYFLSPDLNGIYDAKKNFIKALELNQNDKNAKVGLIVANRNIITNSEYISPQKKQNLFDENDLFINQLIAKDELIYEAGFEKVMLHKVKGEYEEAITLSNTLQKRYSKVLNFKLLHLSTLLYLGRLNEAEKFQSTFSEEYSTSTDNELVKSTIALSKMLVLFMQAEQNNKKLDEFNNYWSSIYQESENLNVCSLLIWNRYLIAYIDNSENNLRSAVIYSNLANQLTKAKENGAFGLVFLEAYAHVANKVGFHEIAVFNQEKALIYAGSRLHVSQINLSAYLLELGDFYKSKNESIKAQFAYQRAGKYAEDSIKIKKTSSAIVNYLEALKEQKKHNKYIHEFLYYKQNYLKGLPIYIVLKTNFGLENCFNGNLKEAKSIYLEVKENPTVNTALKNELKQCINF